MCRVSLLRKQRVPKALWTASLSCLIFAGCVGQKYGFPTFNSQKETQVEPVKASEGAPDTPRTDSPGLAYVALNDPSSSLDEEAQLGGSTILPTSGTSAPVSGAAGQEQNRSNAQSVGQEIDAAFEEMLQQSAAPSASQTSAQSKEFENMVTAVENEHLHLNALRNSLAQLNATSEFHAPPISETAERAPGRSSVTLESVVQIDQQAMAGVATGNGSTAYSVVSPSTKPQLAPGESAEHLLGHNSLSAPGVDAAPPWPPQSESVVTRARDLVSKSQQLVHENSLIGTRQVAETAQSLVQKTQAVLSPPEVTAEQILAEMKQRQNLHQEQLAQSRSQSAPGSVSIDLSRDEINLDKNQVTSPWEDDIQQFAEATVRANRPASLPVINPGQTPFGSSPNLAQANSPSPSGVVQLGQLSADSETQPFILSGDEVPAEAPAYGGNLGSAPQLTPHANNSSGPALSAADAPVLMSPGPSLSAPGTNSSDRDFDEFAADFADVSIEEAPPINAAPLLIDETELMNQSPKASYFSSTTITMLLCGLAVMMLVLFRGRR